jgi:hypothetical protein
MHGSPARLFADARGFEFVGGADAVAVDHGDDVVWGDQRRDAVPSHWWTEEIRLELQELATIGAGEAKTLVPTVDVNLPAAKAMVRVVARSDV